MEEFAPKKALNILLADLQEPAADLFVECIPAANPPQPGSPSKSVGEIILELQPDGRKKIIVSLGDLSKIKTDTYRQAGGLLAQWLVKTKAVKVDLDLDQISTADHPAAQSALLEGLWLGAYAFTTFKNSNQEQKTPTVLVRTRLSKDVAAKMLSEKEIITSAVNLAREWGHLPANIINPITLAQRAEWLAAEYGMKCTVIDDAKLLEMGANAIVDVGKGSKTPSRLILLEYTGKDVNPDEKPVILVGKALTFDSGGYSMKDPTNMCSMKYDKCGGVAVLAIMMAVARLKLPVSLVGVVAAAENMVSDLSYRPDDIVRTLSGKTVEIISTDAEGRLVLADALTYAQQLFQPRAVIDMATLTGGVLTALGRVRAGLMANDDALAEQLMQSGDATAERLWRLPLDEEYGEAVKGDDADLKNSGGREGHCILGGMFLKQFVDDSIPWAHIDIAAMADSPKNLPYSTKGATGFGIRLVVDYLSR